MDSRVANEWWPRPRSIGLSLLLSTMVHAVVANCVTRFAVVGAAPEAAATFLALDVVEQEAPASVAAESVAVTTNVSSPARRPLARRARIEGPADAPGADAPTPRWDRFHVYEETLASPDAIASDVRLAPLRPRTPRAPRLGVPTRVTDEPDDVAATEEPPPEVEHGVATDEADAVSVQAPPPVVVVRLANDAAHAVAIREALELDARLRVLDVDSGALDRLIVVARGGEGSGEWLVAESRDDAGISARSPVVEDVDREQLRTRVGSRTVVCPREDAPTLLAALASSDDATLAIARLLAPHVEDATRFEDRLLVVAVTCAAERECTVEVATRSHDRDTLEVTTVESLEARDPVLASRLAALVVSSTRLAAEP